MTIFTTASIYYLLKYQHSSKPVHLFTAGILIFFGLLSKGPPALFPLSFFFLVFVVFREQSLSKFIANSALIAVVPLVCLLLLISFSDAARTNVSHYLFKTQLIPSLLGKRFLVEPRRFYIVGKLLLALSPVALVAISTGIYHRLKTHHKTASDHLCCQWGTLFLLLGFSASIPIMISPKQIDWYLIPSLPLFMIGFAAIMAPTVRDFGERLANFGFKSTNLLLNLSLFLLTVLISLYSISQMPNTKSTYCGTLHIFGNILPAGIRAILLPAVEKQVKTEQTLVSGIRQAGRIIPRFEIIRSKTVSWNNWAVHGYFQRYFNISLAKDRQTEFFFEANDKLKRHFRGCTEFELSPTAYLVYKCPVKL